MNSSDKPIKGTAMYFHPEFFRIYKHPKEVSCNGVLYNNAYQPPFGTVDELSAATFQMLCDQIKMEMQNPALTQCELLVSNLKIFLITASRLKTQQHPKSAEEVKDNKEPLLHPAIKTRWARRYYLIKDFLKYY